MRREPFTANKTIFWVKPKVLHAHIIPIIFNFQHQDLAEQIVLPVLNLAYQLSAVQANRNALFPRIHGSEVERSLQDCVYAVQNIQTGLPEFESVIFMRVAKEKGNRSSLNLI